MQGSSLSEESSLMHTKRLPLGFSTVILLLTPPKKLATCQIVSQIGFSIMILFLEVSQRKDFFMRRCGCQRHLSRVGNASPLSNIFPW